MKESKALKIFTKVKPKGKFIKNQVDPRLGEKEDEAKHDSHLEQLNWDAVKSLHILP